ncbi:AMP-binding protein [Nocardia africana]|uniref:AMP-binding protein n=1 Tax=Nocardia africana TaxID=134964 RepID=A0ABW6NTM8_9NOCA
MNSPNSFGTLHGRLADIAARHPRVTATFWSDAESMEYSDLHCAAQAAAAILVGRGVARGEPVGILCPNTAEFLVSLFGIVAAGGAATPLPLPASARPAGGYQRQLAAILATAGIRKVVVSHRFADLVSLIAGEVEAKFIDAEDLTHAGDPVAQLPETTPDDLAIVQFTSGSTADPKGVRLSHRQVLSGLAAIRVGIDLGAEDQGAFWLPLFHDMGLIGTLSAILRGIPVHIWSPIAFVKDPARWLAEFAASGATITAMPNFGYEALLSAVAPEQVASYDLRRWRIAFNGAEPISYDVVTRFMDRFGPAGFAPAAMFGVYGMAEATLAVTFPPLGREPVFEWVDRGRLANMGVAEVISPDAATARAVAGVGAPVAGLALRIADTDSIDELPDGRVGEILIRGGSVTSGYLSSDPASAADRFSDGWLRTGDLGYLRGAELFVTGRCKDMITVRGVNHYAQDVEAAVADLPGIYKGRCAATIDPDGDDVIALVAESALTGPAAAELSYEIRKRIAAEVGLASVEVHLVAPRSIPRTSSGKVRRLLARELVPHQQ